MILNERDRSIRLDNGGDKADANAIAAAEAVMVSSIRGVEV